MWQSNLPPTEISPASMRPLLVAHQLVLLPLYFFIPLWISLLNIAVAVWVFFSLSKPQLKLNQWTKLAITVAAIVGVLLVFKKFSGRDAGVALIAVMYGLKILEINSRRDANLVLTLSFFILVSGFFFSQKIWIALYQFIAVIAVLNAFLSLNQLPEKSLGKSELLSDLLANLGKYMLLAIPIMIVLFVFFPRLSGPLWRMPGSSTATTGVSDYMSLTEMINLQTSENIAFRASFKGETPDETDLYWRVLTLDDFDGIGWSRSQRVRWEQVPQTDFKTQFEYSITLEPTKSNYLVALDLPLAPATNMAMLNDQTISSRYRVIDRTRYTLASQIGAYLETTLDPIEREKFTALPTRGNSRIRDWAEEFKENFSTDLEIVNGLLRYINREPYFYSLTPGEMDEQVLDSFWLDKRVGFCEHYASAFVFIARTLGIPARVVVGYQGGEKNPVSDYWIVRDENAHAWTEVWLNQRGWTRVDPTAAIASFRIEDNARDDYAQRLSLFDDYDFVELESVGLLKQIQYWMDDLNTGWNDWVLDYDSGKQRQFFESWGVNGITTKGLVFGMAIGICLLVLFTNLHWFHSRQIHDPIHRAFNQFQSRLGKKLNNPEIQYMGPKALAGWLNSLDSIKYQQHIAALEAYIKFRYQAQERPKGPNESPKGAQKDVQQAIVKSLRKLAI